jgi:hypothetical protein
VERKTRKTHFLLSQGQALRLCCSSMPRFHCRGRSRFCIHRERRCRPHQPCPPATPAGSPFRPACNAAASPLLQMLVKVLHREAAIALLVQPSIRKISSVAARRLDSLPILRSRTFSGGPAAIAQPGAPAPESRSEIPSISAASPCDSSPRSPLLPLELSFETHPSYPSQHFRPLERFKTGQITCYKTGQIPSQLQNGNRRLTVFELTAMILAVTDQGPKRFR